MAKMYDLIKEGLEEVIAYEKGKKDLRIKKVIVPSPPKKARASDVKKTFNN